MTAVGYCTDRDGKRWSAEAPVPLSERGSASLRNLDFAGLPHSTRRHRFFRQASDQTVDRLTVTYGDGRKERKILPNQLLEAVTVLFTEALEQKEKGEQEL